jgi:hypothetical protein
MATAMASAMADGGSDGNGMDGRQQRWRTATVQWMTTVNDGDNGWR